MSILGPPYLLVVKRRDAKPIPPSMARYAVRPRADIESRGSPQWDYPVDLSALRCLVHASLV